MLKVFNLNCVLRNQSAAVIHASTCNYAKKKGGKQKLDDTILKDDTPIEPVQLSYNSYEDLSRSDQSFAPVIIMHGKEKPNVHIFISKIISSFDLLFYAK